MDLSVFLILLFVTLQFVAEYHNWSQYRVKLVIFIATLVLTLPNIIFMVIDWWQSPHSKIALLVWNTFKPILRGETYRLCRWLRSVGMGLTSDELNYLPISNPKNSTDFFMTEECYLAFERSGCICNALLEDDKMQRGRLPFFGYTRCTAFYMYYENEDLFVYQLKFSKKLGDLWRESFEEGFTSHQLFLSSLIDSRTYSGVDIATANRLLNRLAIIIRSEMPILEKYRTRREWRFFHAASTFDYLNKDLVLIQAEGENIAVG